MAERTVQTLKRGFVKLMQTMTLPQEAVTCVVAAYNNSVHRGTGKTPFELMFGRTQKLPNRISK